MKIKSTKQPNPFARRIGVHFKVNVAEMNELTKRAHVYAGGNVSEFVRYAALHFAPGKRDLQK